jgi:spermidine synthase
MAALVTFLFFLSGLVALAYQIVWVRVLGLVVGNSLWATVGVVAAYMGGMAVGSALVAALAGRLRHHLRLYAAAEGVAALAALFTTPAAALLSRLVAHLGAEPLAGWGLPLLGRLGVSWCFLALPTVAMGATLPILVERVQGLGGLVPRVASLYAVNTFGAVVGIVLTAFFALPTLGERATLSAAALLGLGVAAAAWWAETRLPGVTLAPQRFRLTGRSWLVFPALFGFVALACELVWTRLLLLHLGSRVYTFALILAVYLTGIALGAALAKGGTAAPQRSLACWQVGLAAVLALQPLLLARFGDVLEAVATVLRPAGFAGLQLALAVAVAAVLLLPTVAFGASFPLAVGAFPAAGPEGSRTGAVAAANTLGGILGTVMAPLLLVPLLGSQRTLLLLAAGCAGAAARLASPGRLRRLALLIVPLLGGGFVLLPPHLVLRGAAVVGEGVTEALWESASATVMVRRVEDARGSWRSLELNGVNVAGTSPELWAIQRLQGHLPLLLHPHPRSVLHIGFGSGGTAWAVAQHPVQRIQIAEISPEVLAVARRFFADVNHGVLSDPRVEVVLNDGRNVLLAGTERFDVILSDSIHPVYAGNSTLYTREYFRQCANRLADDGVVSMWLPMYSLSPTSFLSILRAFSEVFPSTCVWYDPVVPNEFTVVTGTRRSGAVHLRWQELANRALLSTLAEAGASTPEALAAMLLLSPREVAALVAGVAPHVDDFPEVEYRSGRILDRERSWRANFQLLLRARVRVNPFAAFPGDWQAAVAIRDRALAAHDQELARRIASR